MAAPAPAIRRPYITREHDNDGGSARPVQPRLQGVPDEAERVAQGVAQAVLCAQGQPVIFHEDPELGAARHDRPEGVPHGQVGRGEDRKEVRVWCIVGLS